MARRTPAEAAQTKEAILAAARRLFAERGYNGVSVPDIARAVDVTHGALYHHFPTKEALFRAVFADIENELNDAVVASALAAPTTWGGFVAGTRTVLERMGRPAYLQIALVDAPAIFGWHEWRTVDSAIGMRTMRVGLDLLQAEGFLAGADLDTLAVLLFGALTEAGIHLAGEGSEVDVDRVLAVTCELVLALSPGVQPPDGEGQTTLSSTDGDDTGRS
jgi:AcrR family transcriptional regulator